MLTPPCRNMKSRGADTFRLPPTAIGGEVRQTCLTFFAPDLVKFPTINKAQPDERDTHIALALLRGPRRFPCGPARRAQDSSPVRQHWEKRRSRLSPGTGRKNRCTRARPRSNPIQWFPYETQTGGYGGSA